MGRGVEKVIERGEGGEVEANHEHMGGKDRGRARRQECKRGVGHFLD